MKENIVSNLLYTDNNYTLRTKLGGKCSALLVKVDQQKR